MNSWLILFIAGFFEVGFTTFMKLSDGFTRWGYVALFAASAILSFSCLAQAMKTIPLGTAYAVWTGIGAAGACVHPGGGAGTGAADAAGQLCAG